MTSSFSLPSYFDSRHDARRAFADAHGFAGAAITPLYEDMASRRFFRVTQNGRRAVLMDSLPDDHPQATRGHKIADYIRIAHALREAGVHAPEIIAADEAAGFLLIEDLGDAPPGDEGLAPAVDALMRVRDAFAGNTLDLPDYFQSHIHEGRRRLVDWYAPSVLQRKNPDGWTEDYLTLWRKIEDGLPPYPPGFVHADFHRGNLRALNGECGVLDFQGAQWGVPVYDLVNLLEDARIRLSPAIKEPLKARYKDSLPAAEQDAFEAWYDVLAAQFHSRVAGQFIKLALAGKAQYLAYIPLVQAYLRDELQKPRLAPLGLWLAERGVTFDAPVAPQARYIRPDAY